MSNDVFANGREISCKKADGKSIAAFPDVCMTPPQTPATPPGVPIPYPNTAFASDTTEGSKTVKISGAEIILKDKSYFKTSTGDEAGCAPKKGVVTSKIKGKVYFNAWSMDVKFEGENVVRHLDLTTHNHASKPGQTPPHPYLDASAIANPPECEELDQKLFATALSLPPSKFQNTRKKYMPTAAVGSAPGFSMGSASSVSARIVMASKRSLRGQRYAGMAAGVEPGKKSSIKTCDGKPFEFKQTGRPKSGHAEAKLIEEWFSSAGGNPGGQLLLNVSKSPCRDCSDLINQVNKGSDGKDCNRIKVCQSSISR